jgi:hypothetical protein
MRDNTGTTGSGIGTSSSSPASTTSAPASSLPATSSATPAASSGASMNTGPDKTAQSETSALHPGPSDATRQQQDEERALGGAIRLDRDPENLSPSLRQAYANEEAMRAAREAQNQPKRPVQGSTTNTGQRPTE